LKILAVDDEPFILELLSIAMTRAGFTDISTASSGEIAMAMMTQDETDFDCLLVDISMPGMGGIELCRIARETPGYKNTPIIMLTAMAEREYIDRAFLAGATDYMKKPFNIIELETRLRLIEKLFTAGQKAASDDTKVGDKGSTVSLKHSFDLSDEIYFDLSDEIEIEGIRNLIPYATLTNYLVLLSQTSVASSQVVAIGVDRIKAIYERATTGEFVYALTEAAGAIGAALATNGYLMAYAGNGTFIAVINDPSLERCFWLETVILNWLDKRDTEYDNGDPLDIEVSVGNPIRPVLSRLQQQTIDRAIARLEKRFLEKQGITKQHNIRLIRP
jgi:CheY-like chemotaxis protein